MNESIVLLFDEAKYSEVTSSPTSNPQPMPGIKSLAYSEKDSYWYVREEKSGKFWGDCFTLHQEDDGYYKCNRRFEFEGHSMSYEISSNNIHLYKDIDAFIVERLTAWYCKKLSP